MRSRSSTRADSLGAHGVVRTLQVRLGENRLEELGLYLHTGHSRGERGGFEIVQPDCGRAD